MEFHDEALQKAMGRCAPVIEGDEARLNGISHDIRTLESYLREHVREVVLLDVDFHELMLSSGVEFPCRSERIVDRLVFDPDKGRLLWVVVRAYGDCFGYDRNDQAEVEDLHESRISVRPLIETRVEVRKKVAPHLPAFLEKVAETYGPLPAEQDYGDIPF